MPNPIIDRALWHLLVNGATADTPYPRCFEQPLQRAITRATRHGRSDVADFAQIQLDRMLLLPDATAQSEEREEVSLEGAGWSSENFEYAVPFISGGVTIAMAPFVVELMENDISSITYEPIPHMLTNPLSIACLGFGLMFILTGIYHLIKEG